jgi:cytochrome c-type biogenesis protein CcmF
MQGVGQICLLVTLVASSYAAFVLLARQHRANRTLLRVATFCGFLALVSTMIAVGILVWALLKRDFSFEYVAHYSSRLLPWRYSLSALWVGQAGSLLLWAVFVSGLAGLLRLLPAPDRKLRETAFGVMLANLGFIAAIMVFAADPFKSSLATPTEGLGLSPLLQHPSMLIHPPVIFAAYAAWTVPFALAMAALMSGKLDVVWVHMARPWALCAWAILLVGLLLGADWAYEELGWGGYWGWDPVENGSLLPWLTGTAFIHGLMSWRSRGCLKKTTVALAVVTFGLCNFATFLTRSGIFSSVHAFSESPIGWLFLGFMAILLLGGSVLLVTNRRALAPERSARSILARETLILVSAYLLVSFAAVVMGGTLVGPISQLLAGRTIVVDPSFYNAALIPVGLSLLAIMAAVPVLRWSDPPSSAQRRVLTISVAAGLLVSLGGYAAGLRHGVAIIIVGLVAACVVALLGAAILEFPRRATSIRSSDFWLALPSFCRRYAGYGVHLGIIVLAVGVTGSSVGTRRTEVEMAEGDVVHWAGREVRYVQLIRRKTPDKLVAEAVVEVSRNGNRARILRPARHWHLLQKEWTTEISIDSTWSGDFYTILNSIQHDGKIALTLIENPMMRWLWTGGAIAACCAAIAVLPAGRRRNANQLTADDPDAAVHRRAA